jgi:hypothetical protein
VEFPAFKQQARERRQQKVGEISLGEDLNAPINLLELALGIADLREPLPKGRWSKRAHLFFDQMPEAMTCFGEVARSAKRTRTLPEGVIEIAIMRETHHHDAHPRHAKDGFHVLVTRLELTLSQEFRHGMEGRNWVWFKTRKVGHRLLTSRATRSDVTLIFASARARLRPRPHRQRQFSNMRRDPSRLIVRE